MPELPDITVYLEAMEARILGRTLERVRLSSPFLLRSVDPPLSATEGREVTSLQRLGKRIAIGLEPDLWLVLHLMIAGRLQWKEGSERPKLQKKRGLARFDFASGSLTLTEAGTKKRASLRLVQGEDELARLDPVQKRRHRAELEAGGTQACQVIAHARKLAG